MTCGSTEIVFEEFEFHGTILEKENDEVQNQFVLVTYDLKNTNKGVINVGHFNGPIAKTPNGKPNIK